jgi:hypothetical protein
MCSRQQAEIEQIVLFSRKSWIFFRGEEPGRILQNLSALLSDLLATRMNSSLKKPEELLPRISSLMREQPSQKKWQESASFTELSEASNVFIYSSNAPVSAERTWVLCKRTWQYAGESFRFVPKSSSSQFSYHIMRYPRWNSSLRHQINFHN